MRYIAIDVETTGLDRANHQILEFAAVAARLGTPMDPSLLPMFHCYVDPEEDICGSAYALRMNAGAISEIANGNTIPISELAEKFYNWLLHMGGPITYTADQKKKFNDLCFFEIAETYILPDVRVCRAKLVIAGKNYAHFDEHFCSRIPGWDLYFAPHHRTIDPTFGYMGTDDEAPPDLSTCLKRAGLPSDVKHTAASDAFQVILLINDSYPLCPHEEPDDDRGDL